VILLLALVLGSGTAAAVMLDFSPSVQSVELGQQAMVDVYVRDLSGNRIGAFDFNVEYDPSVLSLGAVDFAAGLGGSSGSFQSTTTPSSGQVNVAEFSYVFDLTPFQDGVSDLLLFSINFNALSTGVSTLTFSENVLGFTNGYLVDELGQSIGGVGVGTGQITVISPMMPVPAPSSIFLLVVGLLSLGLQRRY